MAYSYGINEETYKTLVDDRIDSKDEIDYGYLAYSAIDKFTIIRKEEFEEFKKTTDYILYEVNHIKYNDKIEQYEYSNGGLVVRFSKLSDVMKTKYYDEELHSEERYHKCHEKAIELSPYIPNSKVLTGYLHFGGSKILHSVIEFGSFIIDFNINAVIDKKDYFKLTRFEVKNILESDKIAEDKETRIFHLLWDEDIPLKIYLLFRDELIKDLENKKGKLF